MAKNTKTQSFRVNATEKMWREMVNYHENHTEKEFREQYSFSWSSIINDATERGYYEKKRKHSAPSPVNECTDRLVFSISGANSKRKKIARSIQLYEDTCDRLRAIEEKYMLLKKFDILDQLLSFALEHLDSPKENECKDRLSFSVTANSERKKIMRSTQLYDDTYNLLQSVEAKYMMLRHFDIIDQLLVFALNHLDT